MLCRCLLDHLEQAGFFFLTVDDELSAEDLVAAVLGVDLCKTKYLRVGQPTAHVLLHLFQVGDFLRAECQSLLLVVGFQVVDMLDGLRLNVHAEHLLRQAVVESLEHRVGLIAVFHRDESLDAGNTREPHVLRDFHGIGAPGGHHFAARANKAALQIAFTGRRCLAEKPTKFTDFLRAERMVHLGCYHML